MSRIRVPINTTVDPAIRDRIARWIEQQPVAPNLSAVVERALIEFLEKHETKARKKG